MLLAETLKHHDPERFEFHYMYFLPWKNQMAGALTQNNARVVCIRAGNNIKILLSYSKVMHYINQHHINLIHCHLPWAGFVGRFVHKLIGIPVIYTEHNKQERYHPITRFINKSTFNWQTAVVAVSSDVQHSIRQNIRVKIPVQVITNGVDTTFFSRDVQQGQHLKEKLGIPPRAVLVGTIAVFRFQKRLKEWLTVFAQATSSNPLLYGIIVGDGPQKEEITRQRCELGLENRVFMPGLQEDVRPWLSAMDIFMMTSVFEGLPVALLEAMSMECAVIATEAGGIGEVVRNNIDGITVPVDKWQNLAEVLTVLCRDKTAITRLGKSARKRVVDSFSLKRMVQELETLYEKTIG